jgi:hypothetical protein
MSSIVFDFDAIAKAARGLEKESPETKASEAPAVQVIGSVVYAGVPYESTDWMTVPYVMGGCFGGAFMGEVIHLNDRRPSAIRDRTIGALTTASETLWHSIQNLNNAAAAARDWHFNPYAKSMDDAVVFRGAHDWEVEAERRARTIAAMAGVPVAGDDLTMGRADPELPCDCPA